jgi:hypothetical protein
MAEVSSAEVSSAEVSWAEVSRAEVGRDRYSRCLCPKAYMLTEQRPTCHLTDGQKLTV